MNKPLYPVLYSFRRCPYAMRARLAIASAGIRCELREIILKDKALEFLSASPKGTVPVLVNHNLVIEESIEIMQWALKQNDPELWLDIPPEEKLLIDQADQEFKSALDRYKYSNRFDKVETSTERSICFSFLEKLEDKLQKQHYLAGSGFKITDAAIVVFVRQFAFVDKDWFDLQPIPNVQRWLDKFLHSERFTTMMAKYQKWVSDALPVYFP